MPNIGALLKEEFSRLARRVSRQADAKLRKDIVFLKHQVAELKRTTLQFKRNNCVFRTKPISVTDQADRRHGASRSPSRTKPITLSEQADHLGRGRE